MDKIDAKLLYGLSVNAKTPIKQLAKGIRLSESSAIYRIEKLKQDGILLGTTAIVNSYLLGYSGFRAYVFLMGTTKTQEDEIVSWLVKQKEASVVATTLDFREIGIMSWVKSSASFSGFIRNLKEKYGKFIASLQIFPYVGTIYYPRNYLVTQESASATVVRPVGSVSCDDLDLAILRELSVDCRKSCLEISSKLKVSAKTVINRINSLERKGVIAGYTANINVSKLGYHYYKLNIVFSNNVRYSELLSFAEKSRFVTYIDETISQYDVELNVEVPDDAHLKALLDGLKEEFGGIRLLEIKQVDKYPKMSFLSV